MAAQTFCNAMDEKQFQHIICKVYRKFWCETFGSRRFGIMKSALQLKFSLRVIVCCGSIVFLAHFIGENIKVLHSARYASSMHTNTDRENANENEYAVGISVLAVWMKTLMSLRINQTKQVLKQTREQERDSESESESCHPSFLLNLHGNVIVRLI